MVLSICFGVDVITSSPNVSLIASTWKMVPGAHTTDAYMREGVTNESKSHPLVHGSWKYAWWHCLSRSERDAYPLVSLSLAAWVIENLLERALKVTPRYTYDPTTSTGLWERIREWVLIELQKYRYDFHMYVSHLETSSTKYTSCIPYEKWL